MIARVPGDRQAPALDGVREQDAWPVLLRVAVGERGQQRAEVVSSQVGDERSEFVVGDARAEVLDRRRSAVEEPLAYRGGLEAEQRLVVLVRHRVNPVAQAQAAGPGEGCLQGLAV